MVPKDFDFITRYSRNIFIYGCMSQDENVEETTHGNSKTKIQNKLLSK